MTDKERIAELEKENAELQQMYLEESYEKAKLVEELKEAEDIPTIAYLQGASRQNEKISKLIEIIKDGIVIARKPIAYQDPIFLKWRKRWAERADDFINAFKDGAGVWCNKADVVEEQYDR